ncbi:MAG: hypothetical protein ACRDJC_06330 [Thermomicrobiales bacterium]
MDDERFDALTSRLTGVLSRRRLGPVLGGLGLSGGLGPTLAGDSVAKKGKRRKKGKKKKCNACNSGETTCGQTCIDTRTDGQNCGRCGARCNQGQVCIEGLCWTPCPEASLCSAGVSVPKFCADDVFCVDVAGTPVCAGVIADAGCDEVIDCAEAPCPSGTACAVLCCGAIREFCMAPA